MANDFLTPNHRQIFIDSEYSNLNYRGAPLTDLMVKNVEKKLGVKLPSAYIELLRLQNGGVLKENTFILRGAGEVKFEVYGIFGIDSLRENSLCGSRGHHFLHDEWGYPPFGVYFADCPSAGREMICFDYRDCGPNGEPTVLHIDQELNYKATVLANCFADFIDGMA